MLNEINADNYRIDHSKAVPSESFEFKTKIIWTTLADNNISDTEVVVPLEYLSNFWRTLDLPSKHYITSEISKLLK